MKYSFICIILFIAMFSSSKVVGQSITMGTLLEEMDDFIRLTEFPDKPYKYIQFSSYDRRSTKVSGQGWFANSDGFGSEPIPGFEEVLKAPGEDGIGEYLICDVKGAGAILRLWTARINGNIRLYLDGGKTPVYEGDAQAFFWETAEKLSHGVVIPETSNAFRQFDATYFPIPFAKSCRIEWAGDIKKLHFYHVGIRIYESGSEVKTFTPDDMVTYLPGIVKASDAMKSTGSSWGDDNNQAAEQFEALIPKGTKKEIIGCDGSKAIGYLSMKIESGDLKKLLRQNILNIYFDGSPTAQVQSPIGDFFGAAPGINPYQSSPFSVYPDGHMECRFLMPFKDSAKVEIENLSGQDISISGQIKTSSYEWEHNKSMHFYARWSIDQDLTASDKDIIDIPYLVALGKGRVVGASCYLMNPTEAPTSNGNWWGEGDEKIFVDKDTFPSLFGTGSEDYYNYSWSSPDIFSYPYCGQPRNDGPGNRGFVCNYRWHILDDILFAENLAFYMELLHHGVVPGFDYARMVYLYALPGLLDNHNAISPGSVREQILPGWEPIAYRGSAGYKFLNAEELISPQANISVEEGGLWSGGKILMWSPNHKGDKINLTIPNDLEGAENKLVITFAHLPEGGKVSVYINSKLTEFRRETVLNLYEPYHKVLMNHSSVPLILKKGSNDLTIEYVGDAKDKKVGVDFIWVKE